VVQLYPLSLVEAHSDSVVMIQITRKYQTLFPMRCDGEQPHYDFSLQAELNIFSFKIMVKHY